MQLKSLRLKLIAAFSLLTLIPLAATGIYGHFFTSQALSGQALERSINQVHLQAESIDSAFRQVEGDALYLSALRSLNMLRQQNRPDQVALWTHEVGQDLLVLASLRPMYYAIRLLDIDGYERLGVRATEDRVRLITDLESRSLAPYFTETMKLAPNSVYVSPFQTQDASGAPYIHYAVRLPDGVLVIDLHAGWLLRALPDNTGADTWAMVDQAGRFLVYSSSIEPDNIRADVPNMLSGESGTLETADSVYVYDTVAPTDNTYWVIFRHTPTSIFYESVDHFYHVALFLSAIAATLGLVLAVGFSRVFVEPVKRLQAMTVEFGREGVAPTLPEHLPHDEIGALTRAFIDMAVELQNKRLIEHRLIERLIRAQEEERKLLAYDLHDGLIQQMVGARFYLTKCRDICPINEHGVSGSVQRGCDALSEAIVEGRRIIEGLRPAALDDLGLIAAIQEIAGQTAAAAGWELTLELETLPAEPEKTVGVTLYRIAQEALNNARKHAKAQRVRVSLHNGGGITMEIHDDGIGFDPKALVGEGRGLGITTMHERASLLGGRCALDSQPGAGTRVAVYVPYEITIEKETA
jgi:signal transduction histidine kinase